MITRVSTLSMQKNMLNQLNKNQLSYYEAQLQALSGSRINSVSDDPIGAAKILGLNDKLSQISSYGNNVASAQEEYAVLDSALSNIIDKLQKVNELSVEAANGTNSSSTLDTIKTEIEQLKATLLSLANTQYNGQYIFSGTNTMTTPYSTDADGSVTYAGTGSTGAYQRRLEVSDGVYLTLNVSGDSMFGGYDAATETGSGIFGTLSQLTSALENGDFDAIRESINSVQADLENVTLTRSKYGGYAERADMYASTLSENNVLLTEQKSGIQNIDLAEAYTKLTAQQYALQASYQVFASSMSLSLLDYI